MIEQLADFLRQQAGRRFAWGEADCCLTAADWVRLVRGVDPAADFRGRYASERGAYRLLRRDGGLLDVMSVRLLAAGIAVTDTPQPGDVGVVLSAGREVAAIRVRSGWAGLGRVGLSVSAVPCHRAWSIV